MKHRKHNIKRQHEIIKHILPLLEEISKIEGVKGVIPARIYNSPSKKIFIRVQRETPTGLKALAHNMGAIQEIFILCDNKKEVKDKIDKLNLGKRFK